MSVRRDSLLSVDAPRNDGLIKMINDDSFRDALGKCQHDEFGEINGHLTRLGRGMVPVITEGPGQSQQKRPQHRHHHETTCLMSKNTNFGFITSNPTNSADNSTLQRCRLVILLKPIRLIPLHIIHDIPAC